MHGGYDIMALVMYEICETTVCFVKKFMTSTEFEPVTFEFLAQQCAKCANFDTTLARVML